jgi:hypothetical protein
MLNKTWNQENFNILRRNQPKSRRSLKKYGLVANKTLKSPENCGDINGTGDFPLSS